jgi:hypothetical protein
MEESLMHSPEFFDRRFTRDRSYNIKQLWQSHEAILRLTATGLNNKQVAAVTGVTPQTVSNARNSPAGRAKLLEYSASLDQQMLTLTSRFKEFSPQAESLLEDIVTGSIPAPISIRARYAADLLDRAGHGAVKKVMSMTTTLTRDDIEAIKSRALTAAKEAGHAIDITPAS